MAASRYANKPDSNKAEVVDALRADGWRVQSFEIMRGRCLDLFIARESSHAAGLAVVIPVEIKKSPKEKLTPAELKFIDGWPGPCLVVYGGQDAVDKAWKLFTA